MMNVEKFLFVWLSLYDDFVGIIVCINLFEIWVCIIDVVILDVGCLCLVLLVWCMCENVEMVFIV